MPEGSVKPLAVEHRQHKGLNNRAELLHQPIRQQEPQMRRCTSARQAQRFLFVHALVGNLFGIRSRHLSATEYRFARCQALMAWQRGNLCLILHPIYDALGDNCLPCPVAFIEVVNLTLPNLPHLLELCHPVTDTGQILSDPSCA